MKKVKSSILAGLAALLLVLPVWKDTSLKDISKPHLGVYECTQATLGSKDVLGEFSDIRLELKDEESFVVLYKRKKGKTKEWKGKYRYDKERGVFIVEEKGKRKEFPFEEGKVTVIFPVGKKNMVLCFEQK